MQTLMRIKHEFGISFSHNQKKIIELECGLKKQPLEIVMRRSSDLSFTFWYHSFPFNMSFSFFLFIILTRAAGWLCKCAMMRSPYATLRVETCVSLSLSSTYCTLSTFASHFVLILDSNIKYKIRLSSAIWLHCSLTMWNSCVDDLYTKSNRLDCHGNCIFC